MKTNGQLEYEKDVRYRPAYYNGTPRPKWEQLTPSSKGAWERAAQTRIRDMGNEPPTDALVWAALYLS